MIMCVLAKPEIMKMVDKGKIRISPFDPDMVDAASVDFRLGNKFRTFRGQKKAYDLSEEIDPDSIGKLTEIMDGKHYLLKPGELILGITKERLRLPDNICGRFEGRSSLARIGLMVHITSGLIHPGSSGNQVLEIINLSNVPIKLYPGIRICQIIFQRMKGKARGTSRFALHQDSP